MATRPEHWLTSPKVNASVSTRFLSRLVTANPRDIPPLSTCGLVAWSGIPEEVLGFDESDFADGRKLQVAIAVFFTVPLHLSNSCRIRVEFVSVTEFLSMA